METYSNGLGHTNPLNRSMTQILYSEQDMQINADNLLSAGIRRHYFQSQNKTILLLNYYDEWY